ncbi:MAG: pectate lyase, partial [Synechococcus sp.]
TLHNIGWFQDRLDAGTFLATLGVLAVVVLAPRWMRALTKHCSESMAPVVRALTPAVYSWPLFLAVSALAFCIATRTFSELILNRDQEWGELVLYASIYLLLLRTRVLLGPVQHAP